MYLTLSVVACIVLIADGIWAARGHFHCLAINANCSDVSW